VRIQSLGYLVIVKNRDITSSWLVRHSSLAANQTPLLENTVGYIGTDYWQNTHPDADKFYVSGNSEANGSTNDLIAYCFHSVEGFSKFGSYTGNGSTDGSFIYCGFRPAFVMVKRTDAVENWAIFDDKRLGYNPDNNELQPNTANAEGTADFIDILSNGFKNRNSDGRCNASGGTYIFMAFSDANGPFKYANAR